MQGCCKWCNECGFRAKEEIAILEQEKKNFLLNLFDANELVNKVKVENIKLVEKVKDLELELSIAREQSNKSASSKLDHI